MLNRELLLLSSNKGTMNIPIISDENLYASMTLGELNNYVVPEDGIYFISITGNSTETGGYYKILLDGILVGFTSNYPYKGELGCGMLLRLNSGQVFTVGGNRYNTSDVVKLFKG